MVLIIESGGMTWRPWHRGDQRLEHYQRLSFRIGKEAGLVLVSLAFFEACISEAPSGASSVIYQKMYRH